jgi:ubiquinone/menaquinone biosynthesis C-methylase UbiE
MRDDITNLRKLLQECKARNDAAGIDTLSPRKLEEMTFHDNERGAVANCDKGEPPPDPNRKFYAVTETSDDDMHQWIETHAPGKVFLDYACGYGGYAVRAARAGAALAIGLDISPVSVQLAEKHARESGVSENTFFLRGDCENTGLPDNSIDLVLCSGMLHHLDLSYAFPEIRRILKPGGLALAGEALGYNPAIALYRMLTPNLRTNWEKHHILTFKDVRFAKRFFRVRNIRYWHLATLLAVPFYRTRLFRPALAVANAIDRVLLKVPPICYLAWMFYFEMVKEPSRT